MSALRYDGVLFDMDGVLCDLDDEARLDYLIARGGRDRETLRQAIWGSGFEDEADEGRYDAETYLFEFGVRAGWPITVEEWCAYRSSGMTAHGDVLAFASRLADRCRIGVLTNNGPLLEREFGVVFPELGPVFGGNLWCSSRFGARKPDPRVFVAACELLGTPPERTLMVDDREANVAGARAAGLEAHRFTDLPSLVRFVRG
ncbi:MAG: HAD family phosphatase [Fimbriimonadaceae bacterium]|nr:HAD family phosphatase [Fimbriimonadaceae bacterium]